MVYTHFGEGEYDTTENNIRYLLGMGKEVNHEREAHYSSDQTPELYLGYARIANFANDREITENKASKYNYPHYIPKNYWALNGEWVVYPDRIESVKQLASIKLHFSAEKIYAVMGTKSESINSLRSYIEPTTEASG